MVESGSLIAIWSYNKNEVSDEILSTTNYIIMAKTKGNWAQVET